MPTFPSTTFNRPHVVITFRVQRVYKGEAGSEVQVHTGFGGGDCGAQFSSGLTYLLFLLPQTDGVYGVTMCSPGGWTLGPQVPSQLRYLRGETPAPDDLLLPKRWSPEHSKEEIDQAKTDAARFNTVAAEQTGTICGRVERDAELRAEWGDVRLLSLLGYSPAQQPTAYLEDDGTFCAKYLGPGKYKLRFESRDAFAYFPSTSSWDEAEPIEVAAGQTLSGITIRPIRHETYSVLGSLSIDRESELSGATVHIVLLSMDPVGPGFGRVESMAPVSLFGKRFFFFTGVRPGRYVAIATVGSSDWLSTELDFTISSESQFISLEMTPAK